MRSPRDAGRRASPAELNPSRFTWRARTACREARSPSGTTPRRIAAPTTSWPSHGKFRIGRSLTGDYFAGKISDVRAFNRTVVATEIAAIADSAVGRWGLDGNTGDDSWFARDGVPRPELVRWTTDPAGRPSSARDLTGSETIDVRPSALFTDRSYAVSAWVRLADMDGDDKPDAAGDQVVASQDGDVRGAFYLMYQNATNRWVFTIPVLDEGYTNWQTVKSANAPSLNEWTHLTAVWNAGWGRMQLYVDGALQETRAATSWSSTRSLHIGVSADGGRFVGPIDDVRVYQRVLSASEIAAAAG